MVKGKFSIPFGHSVVTMDEHAVLQLDIADGNYVKIIVQGYYELF